MIPSVDSRALWVVGAGLGSVAVSAAAGHFAWDGQGGVAAAAFVPALWWLLSSRMTVALAATGYYAAALYPVRSAIEGFFPSWPHYLTLVVLGAFAAASAFPWWALWQRHGASPGRRVLGLLGAVVVGIAPPLGVVAWCHPLLAAGWIVPGWGWWGLCVLLGAWAAVAAWPRLVVAAIVVVCLTVLSGWVSSRYVEARPLVGVHAMQLAVGNPRSVSAISGNTLAVAAGVDALQRKAGDLVVLPETFFPQWRPATQALARVFLQPLAALGPMLVGTTIESEGKRYNAAIVIDESHDAEVPAVYLARQPLVLSMWRPWDGENHHSARWTGEGVVSIGGRRLALRLCSEEFALAWTLIDLWREPGIDGFVTMSNHWWSSDPIHNQIQAQHMHAQARLFGLPVSRALNRMVAKGQRDQAVAVEQDPANDVTDD